MVFPNLISIDVFKFTLPPLNAQYTSTTPKDVLNLLLPSQLSPYGLGNASLPWMIKKRKKIRSHTLRLT